MHCSRTRSGAVAYVKPQIEFDGSKRKSLDQIWRRSLPRIQNRAVALVGSGEHKAVADRIANASVTVIEGSLPPAPERPLILATLMARRFGPSVETRSRSALSAEGRSDVDLLLLNPQPDRAEIKEAIEHARLAGWTALLHFNRVESFDPDAVLARDELTALTDAIAETGSPVVVASMGSPYILPAFHHTAAQLQLQYLRRLSTRNAAGATRSAKAGQPRPSRGCLTLNANAPNSEIRLSR